MYTTLCLGFAAMDIPRYQLFLGFLVDSRFQKELDLLDQDFKNVFIREGSNYLQQVSHGGNIYLGKYLGERSDLQTLHSVEKNIYSLIAKLTPNYPCQEQSLRLFPAEVTTPELAVSS